MYADPPQPETHDCDCPAAVYALSPVLPAQRLQLYGAPLDQALGVSQAERTLTHSQEVALSALYVSAKLHDTLKRSRDLILTSYALRLPHLVKKGVVDVVSVDPKVLEGERKRVVSIERILLESMCFRFEARTAFDGFVALAQSLKREYAIYVPERCTAENVTVSKARTKRAWLVTIDACVRLVTTVWRSLITADIGRKLRSRSRRT